MRISDVKRFAVWAIALIALVAGASFVAGQQQVYGPGSYHGPFIDGGGVQSLNQMLSPAFEIPQVQAGAFTSGTSSYAVWGQGRVYPDGIGTVSATYTQPGINVQANSTGVSLAASKTSCDFPALSSCNILFVPYQSITGTVTGTFTVGELATQASSSATAYVMSSPTAGSGVTVWLSKTVSGTPDATHTWTGGSSSATLASPTAAPSNLQGSTVLSTATLSIATLPGVTPIAYVATASTYQITSITYPYQITNPIVGQTMPTYGSVSGAPGVQLHSVYGTGAVGTGITLSNSAAFTSALTFSCMVSDTTGSHAAWAEPTSGTAITIGGTSTDAVNYVCTGY